MALVRQPGTCVFTSLLTPFDGGWVDYAALDSAIDRQVAAGMDGIVVLDTTGEGHTLHGSEGDRILATAVRRADGRLPVVAATGTNCTATTIERSQRAAALGADVLLVTVPYYSKPRLAGVVDHFRQLTRAVHRPIIVDDDPARTAIDLGAGLVSALAEIRGIAGICHGCGRLAFFAGLPPALRGRFLHLSREEAILPAFLAAGGGGTLSPLANILPTQVRALVDACADADGTATPSEDMVAAFAAIAREDIAALKEAAFCVHGHPADVRLPLVAADAETVVRVRHAFAPFARSEAETAVAA